MLLTLDQVVSRTQVLLDDPSGSTFDSGYLLGFINQRWDDIATKLDALSLQYEEQRVVLGTSSVPVPANTTDLSAYMATGQPLASMLQPVWLEWKIPTDPDTNYQPIDLVDRLPDVDPSYQGIVGYEWRGGVIYVTPSSIGVIIRVRFQAVSTNLVDPTDQTVRGVANVLAYMVAELIWAIRGDEKMAANMRGFRTEAYDDFLSNLVKKSQGKVQRVGRMSRRSRFTKRFGAIQV